MAEIYLDKEEKDALAKSGLDSANSLYGLANAGALTAESCRGLTPQEITELETSLAADKLGIKADKKPLLQQLFNECKKTGATSAVGAASAPPAGPALGESGAPSGKWRPSQSIVSFDSSSFEDIPNKGNPTDSDIYSAAMTVEKNMGRWLYQSKEQWDDRLIQFGVTQTEWEHIFTLMSDYVLPNTSGTASFHGRSSNMETVTKLLVEYEADPKKAAEVYTKLQRMSNSIKSEADTNFVIQGAVVPVLSTGVGTLLAAWAVSHFWLKDAGIKGVSAVAGGYDALAMGLLKKMPWFSPTKFDFDALPKDVRDIVEKQMRTTINKIRVAESKPAFTDTDFTTGGSDAEKAFNDMKTKMSKKMPFSAGGMMDEYKGLTDSGDMDGKKGALKKVGKAVGGTGSGRFGGKALEDGRSFMEGLKKGVPSPVKVNLPGLKEALLTSDEHNALTDIQNRAREVESVKKQIDELQSKRDEKLQGEITRLGEERTRLQQQLTELEGRRQSVLQQQSSTLGTEITRLEGERTTIQGTRTTLLQQEYARLEGQLNSLRTGLGEAQRQRIEYLEGLKRPKVTELQTLIRQEVGNVPDWDKDMTRDLNAAATSSDPHTHPRVQQLATTNPNLKAVIDSLEAIEVSKAGTTDGRIATDSRLSTFDAKISGFNDPSTGSIALKTNELTAVNQAQAGRPHMLTTIQDGQITSINEKLNGTAGVAGKIAEKASVDAALAGGIHSPHSSVAAIDGQIRGLRSGNPAAPGLLDAAEATIRDMNQAKVNKTPHTFVNADDVKLAGFRTQLTNLFTDPVRGIDTLLTRLKTVALGNDIKLLIPANYLKGTTHTVNGELIEKIGQLYEGIIKGITKARTKK